MASFRPRPLLSGRSLRRPLKGTQKTAMEGARLSWRPLRTLPGPEEWEVGTSENLSCLKERLSQSKRGLGGDNMDMNPTYLNKTAASWRTDLETDPPSWLMIP